MRIVQHVPGFVSGYKAKECEAPTWEELLATDWVSDYRIHDGKEFYRFSIVHDEAYDGYYLKIPERYSLIAEFNNGEWWWVVGHLDQDIPELPRWISEGEKKND